MNNCIALSSILLIISLAVSISKADIYDGCSLGINCIAVPRSDLGSGSDTEEKCVANKVSTYKQHTIQKEMITHFMQ